MCGFEMLRNELKLIKTQTHDLMVQAARRGMLGSFSIWCSRNHASSLTAVFVCGLCKELVSIFVVWSHGI